MARLLTLVLVVLLLLPRPTFADEPSFNGRKMSEWVTMLKEDMLVRKRKAAAVAIGQMVSGNTNAQKDALPILAKAMKIDSNAGVRAQIASILGQQSTDSAAMVVPDLAEALRSEKDSDVRKELAIALGHFGKLASSSVLPLIDLLKDSGTSTRIAAADALGRIGKDARRAAPTVLELLKDNDRGVRHAAVFALGRIDPDEGESAAEGLLALLAQEQAKLPKSVAFAASLGAAVGHTHRDVEMISSCIVSLGLLGERSPEVVKGVAKQLADPDLELRQLAALTLGKYGIVGRVASAELKQSFQTDADKLVRIYAVNTLGQAYGADGKELIPLLVPRLKIEPEFEVRIAIVELLGSLGAAGKDALPALQEARRDAQLKVREAAATAIRQIQKPIEKPKP